VRDFIHSIAKIILSISFFLSIDFFCLLLNTKLIDFKSREVGTFLQL
jgi:hypothetical protein